MSDIFEENRPKVRLLEKVKKQPTPVIGLAGLVGVIGYSIFNFRKRNKEIKPSVYLIQTRVFAQGMVVGALTLSLFYHMYQTYKRPELVQEVSKVVTIVEPSEIIKIKES